MHNQHVYAQSCVESDLKVKVAKGRHNMKKEMQSPTKHLQAKVPWFSAKVAF
jgi:hypothetical protein